MSKLLITICMIIGLIFNLKNTESHMLKSGRIKGPAGYLYYDDGGQGGIPVVFVHSFGGSTAHWQDQLDLLRKNRRAVAIDMRGHGRSDAPSNGDYAVKSLAADISALVDSLKLQQFVLVGHSMGGSAAIAYAGTHPHRVTGLLLSGTPGKADEAQAKQIIASLESDAYDKVMADYMDRLLKNATPAVDSMERTAMSRLSKKTNLNIIKNIFKYDPLPALKLYPGPKMIVATEAEKDPNSLHSQMPDIPYKSIEGASHWTQMDKPKEFNKILTDFLETTDKHK